MKFLKDNGFLEKFPEWETFESNKKAVPQDILDAIVFTISAEKHCQFSWRQKKLKDSLKRLKEDAQWLAQKNINSENSPAVLDADGKPAVVTFEIPTPEEISYSLSNNLPPHNLKVFKFNLDALRDLLYLAEWRIRNYLKEDVYPEMKLYRKICIRTVEYISEMLPDDLRYDTKDLKEKYTQVLDNYMDTLAWKHLGINKHFSTHDFIDCWNVDSLFYSRIKQESSKQRDKSLRNSIKESLTNLNMPHIRVFDYNWEERLFTYSEKKSKPSDICNYNDIVDYYLDIAACDSKNIRQIIWAIEGKKVRKEIDLFFHRLGFFERLKYQYSDVTESVYKTILEGFNDYFETMPPGSLWLKLSDVWNLLNFEQLL